MCTSNKDIYLPTTYLGRYLASKWSTTTTFSNLLTDDSFFQAGESKFLKYVLFDMWLVSYPPKRASGLREQRVKQKSQIMYKFPWLPFPIHRTQVLTQFSMYSKRRILQSALLEVVAGNQPNPSIAVVDLSLPPSIVLVAQNGQHIAFGECQFLRNCCLIHVHCTSCDKVSRLVAIKGNTRTTYQSAKSVYHLVCIALMGQPRSCCEAGSLRRTS